MEGMNWGGGGRPMKHNSMYVVGSFSKLVLSICMSLGLKKTVLFFLECKRTKTA